MPESHGWRTPRDMLRALSPARLSRFVSRDWQANAVWELIFGDGVRLPHREIDRRRAEEAERLREAHLYRLTLEAGGALTPAEVARFHDVAGFEWRAERAWEKRGEALDVLRSLHLLKREHSPLTAFLHDAANADRVVAGHLRAAAKTSPPAETVVRLVTVNNWDTLLRSPLFWWFLLFAWNAAADDRPDRQQDVTHARALLEAVVGLLSAPLREKGLHRAVRVRRAKAAEDLLRTNLPRRVALLREQERATRGLMRRSDILEALNRWQEERDRLQREKDAAAGRAVLYGTASVGLRVPCPTCGGDADGPHGMTATALAFYRQRHAKKGRRGLISLRDAAAAALLHRCPEDLSAHAVTTALARLKKREAPGKIA